MCLDFKSLKSPSSDFTLQIARVFKAGLKEQITQPIFWLAKVCAVFEKMEPVKVTILLKKILSLPFSPT